MLSISIKSNTDQIIRQLKQWRGRIPYATAQAINETAKAVVADEYHEMVDVFDRPTPYTLNSLYRLTATKDNLRAIVALKDNPSGGTPADKYLNPQIHGGSRDL